MKEDGANKEMNLSNKCVSIFILLVPPYHDPWNLAFIDQIFIAVVGDVPMVKYQKFMIFKKLSKVMKIIGII